MSDNFNSIKEFVDDIGGKYAQNIAYRFFRDEVIEDRTYADLKRDAYGLASALVQKGLKSEHIAILGSTSYEWIVSFLAVILSGNVVIPIDKMLLEKEMMFLFSEGDVSAILYDNEFEETAKKAKKEIKKIKNIFDMSSEEFKSLFKTKEEELPITDPEGLCEILFTSGTTGVSKGVMISQKNIISNLKEIHRLDFASNFAGPKVALSVLPVHHTFELTVDNLGILCYGATICINDKIENIAANMNIFKPSVILIVPAIAEALYKKIKDSMADPKTARKIKTGKRLAKAAKVVGMDARRTIFKSLLEKFGGNLCNVVVGGAALRSEIVECFAEFGINVFQGYGLTECAPLVCANCPAEGKIGSVGKPRNVEVKTVNGEIVVKGDVVMLGYYKNQEATDEVIKDGWFYTGDLGHMDKDGYVYFKSRLKRMIVSSGYNIYPSYIENIINKHEYVASCSVVGVPDKSYTETREESVHWYFLSIRVTKIKRKQ